MGEYEKHIRMAQEKLKAVRNAFKKGQHTVVGDLAIEIENQDKILKFFEKRFGEQLEE